MNTVELWTPDVHRELVAAWVSGHGKVPADLFAQISPTGIVVNRRVAGWLYMTNGPIAFADQFVSDPLSQKEDRRRDIHILIKALCSMAKESGHDFIVGCSGVTSLTKATEEEGFMVVCKCDYTMRLL